jgi:solute carrier family 25 carnitine/acylcarnitine transporter 20/29
MEDCLRINRVAIAAATAASTGVLLGYPFDTIKTRMQAYRYSSTRMCVQEIWSKEGYVGFYKGVGPVLFTNALFRALSFSIYNNGKSTFNPIAEQYKLSGINAIIFSSGISGVIAGAVISFLSGLN